MTSIPDVTKSSQAAKSHIQFFLRQWHRGSAREFSQVAMLCQDTDARFSDT